MVDSLCQIHNREYAHQRPGFNYFSLSSFDERDIDSRFRYGQMCFRMFHQKLEINEVLMTPLVSTIERKYCLLNTSYMARVI